MNKEELMEQILSSMTEEDWDLLEGRTSGIPVSAHNREVLLKLRDCEADFDDEKIDAGRVEEARLQLADFLERTWAEA